MFRSSCLFLPGRPGSNVGFSDALGICIRSGSGGGGFPASSPNSQLAPLSPPPTPSHTGKGLLCSREHPSPPQPPHIHPGATPLCSSVSPSTKAGVELEAGWDVCGGHSPVLAAEAVVWAHPSSHAGSRAAQGRDRLLCGNMLAIRTSR